MTSQNSELYNKPWLISENYFREMLSGVDKSEALELLEELPAAAPAVVNSATAILSISGVLMHKPGAFRLFFGGGVATEKLSEVFKGLVDDDAISRIVLDIDSPGGEVDGIQQLAQQIYEAREKKEIIAYVNETAASAGYWIASAANKVYLASTTATAGSVGVVAIHRDISKLEEKMGVVTTEIVAGKYKRATSMHKPLSEEGKKTLQAQVDYLYALFVDDVARNRGKEPESVIADMAEGRIFLGRQAVDAGLADDVLTLDQILTGKGQQVAEPTKIEYTLEVFEKENPVLLEEIKAKAFDDGKKAGIEAERKRVESIRALKIEGFENVTDKAIADGEAPEQVSLKLVKAVQDRGITLQQMKNESQVAEGAASGDDTGDSEEVEKEALIKAAAAAANEKRRK